MNEASRVIADVAVAATIDVDDRARHPLRWLTEHNLIASTGDQSNLARIDKTTTITLAKFLQSQINTQRIGRLPANEYAGAAKKVRNAEKAAFGWYSPSTYTDKHRDAAHWQGSNIIVLDSDATVEDETSAEFAFNRSQLRERLAGLLCIALPTHSYTEQIPRWRILILLDRVITQRNEFSRVARSLAGRLEGYVDPRSFTPEQLWFNFSTPADEWINRRAQILVATTESGKPYDVGACFSQEPPHPAMSLATNPGNALMPVTPLAETPENISRVQRMLKFIDPDALRDQWMRTNWAIASLGWKCGQGIAETWSQGGAKWDPAEFNKVWASYKADGRITFGTLHHYASQAGWSEERSTGATGQFDTWPEPREIKADLPPAPAFNALALLPRTLADFVLDEADRMPCAPDYIASALLVALGAVIGTKCAIKPKRRDDWIVTPNLYGGVVGDPSAKKTPAINTVMRFLDRLEAKESEFLEERLKVFEVELAAFEARQFAVKNSMKKAASGEPDKIKMQAAMADMQNLQPPEEPYARRFKSNDATTEKLGDLLTHNQMGMLVFRDELIGLLASWDKEGREGDRAFYLEGWNGTGSFSIDRIARGSLYIKCLCLSVFGGIQPDLLERYLSGIANSLENDGRIQRFQVLVYPNPVPWEWRDRYPVKGAREAVRDLFDRLASFDPLQDGAAPADDFVKLPYLCFDDAAQDLFIEWSTELHRELIAKEQNPLMQQHFGKFEKLFCSVALILHLAEGNISPVQVASAVRAAAWCVYLAGHARRIYGMVDAAKINTARTLGRRIAEGKLQDHFTARDVWKKGWGSIKSTTDAEAALAILEDYGWLVSYEVSDQPGRPTSRYAINPKIRGQK